MYSRMPSENSQQDLPRVPRRYDGVALRQSEPACEEAESKECAPPTRPLPFLSGMMNSDLLLLLVAMLLLYEDGGGKMEDDLPLLLLLLLFFK